MFGGQAVRQRVLPHVVAVGVSAKALRHAVERKVGGFLERNPDRRDRRSELIVEVISMRLALAEFCVKQEYAEREYERFSRELGLTGG